MFILKYVSWKQRKEVASDLKAIYRAATVEQAALHLEAFGRKWDERYPAISGSWRNNGERIVPLFGYPPDIRQGNLYDQCDRVVEYVLAEGDEEPGLLPQ